MATSSSSISGRRYTGAVTVGIAGVATYWGAIEGGWQYFIASCTLVISVIIGVYQFLPAVFVKMVYRTINYFTSYISSSWTSDILSVLSFGTFLSYMLEIHKKNLSICVDSSQLIMLAAKNGDSSEAILKQLLYSGALVELIKVMKYYLIDLAVPIDTADISPMVQALSLLSRRSLPTKEDDRKIQRDVALKLLKQFSTANPPGISFVSAGIMGHAAA
eukprot:gene35341-47491_t